MKKIIRKIIIIIRIILIKYLLSTFFYLAYSPIVDLNFKSLLGEHEYFFPKFSCIKF